MTNLTQSQPNPNMTFHRIFDIGPRIQSLAFTSDEVKAYVLHFIAKIKDKNWFKLPIKRISSACIYSIKLESTR